ncbi:DUF86 domain-containing protein [soil metagenome]|jgi:uncharacterized protein with HEPN domain
MTNATKKRRLDATAACEAIEEFVRGKDFTEYERDRLLRSAVERQFEILGEALNKAAAADASIAEQIPELHRMVGLRNRLIHGYDTVDDEILWDAIQTKLIPLKSQLKTLEQQPGDAATE